MNTIRNPARSRPLSANVKRLMRMARESPANPAVEKIERAFSTRDLAYCDMQGNIFMAAVDRGLKMSDFAPVFMNSQLAGVIDYSFSRAGGMEDGLDALLATVQRPSGVPVATVAVGGGANAALLAAQILAVEDAALAEKLAEKKRADADAVRAKDAALKL